MSGPPPLAAGGAAAPIARIAAAGLARVAVAAGVLALAALVVTSTGAGGLSGALGSLFGFHSAPAAHRAPGGRPIAGHAVLPASRTRPGATPPSATRRHSGARRRTIPDRPPGAPPISAPGSSPQPIPTPAQPPPAQPPPAPPAAPQPGVVAGVGAAVTQAADALPPPVRPVVDQAVGAVGQVCGLLGGCP
jgi:hypothetical protein